MPDYSAYTYDPRLNNGMGAYRDALGRIVSNAKVRQSLFDYIDAGTEMRTLSQQLQAGNISLADWQAGMRYSIKRDHLTAIALEKGGWAQMSQADYGRAGAAIKKQYEFLDNFAGEIADGKQPLDGRFLARTDLYSEAMYQTYSRSERATAGNSGMVEERNVLDPAARHCPGCIGEAAKGFVPIGSLIPIGERECRTRDRCHYEFR